MGLTPEETAVLLNNTNEDLWQETYAVVREIKTGYLRQPDRTLCAALHLESMY